MERQRHRLSFGQEQLWFISQLFPGETAYNTVAASRLRGRLDTAALRSAVTAVVAHNDMLCVTFGAADGVPYQVVAPAGQVDLVTTDLPGVSGEVIAEAVTALASAPFDLAQGPLYRFTLLRIAPEDHVFVRVIHHIAVDGWAMGIVNQQISTAYRNLRRGGDHGLAATPVGYLDYAQRQRAELSDTALAHELEFWERRLTGLPALDLPADRPRPPARSLRGGIVTRPVSDELADRLRRLAAAWGIPLFALLVAGVQAVISRYTGQEDLPLGVAVFGRTEPEWEGIVGLFVNMVVLRADMSGDPSMEEAAERAAQDLFDAYEHAQAPFENVVERLNPARDPGRNPLFQVAVQMLGDDNAGHNLALDGLVTEPLPGAIGGSRFDLTLNFIESAGALRLETEYSADLFDRWRIEAMAGHIERVLSELAHDPGQRLSALALLSRSERDRLLAWGKGEPSARTGQPVHVIFGQIAAAAPGLLAATYRGQQLTYGELDRRADCLARRLVSLGVGHEDIVAIAMDRSLDFLVAVFGVLKADAAYTVLDPRQPASRLAWILGDTGASVVLTQAAVAGTLPAVAGCRVVRIDADLDPGETSRGSDPLPGRSIGDSLIYVLYTSGSTGKPKGVLLEHRALMSFAESYQRSFRLGPDERVLQLRPLTFDMSNGEIIAALTCGAALVLVPEELVTSPAALARLIAAEEVTCAGMPAALLSAVDAGPYPALRSVSHGGEVIPGELVNKWNLPGRRFVNVYGPTEAAVVCTAHECEHRTWRSPPPIGTVYLDRQVYVVDRWQNLVPVGIAGELLIGGEEGLARGYRNQPGLTRDRFTSDPVLPGGRVYWTGDLARWDRNGQLQFLGRRDTQVKLRGYRIELEEIESVLATHPKVAMAAVALRGEEGNEFLAGYVTAAGEPPPTAAELREHAGAWLPAYMVPSAWRVLDEFPLNSASKVDRAALPPPGAADPGDYTEPRTLAEALLTELYADLLGCGQVGIDDSFFDLGGTSLQAMRLAAQLRVELAVDVGVSEIFFASTPRQLAEALRDKHCLDDEPLREENGQAGAGQLPPPHRSRSAADSPA